MTAIDTNKLPLGLYWPGKADAASELAAVAPTALRLDREKSNVAHDSKTGNLLIHGDNLRALNALLRAGYAGKVKCVYIDPPYNADAGGTDYDDNFEHSVWLSFMWQRLTLIKELMAEGGSLWVSIDDDEGHYLKALADDIFGRRNFVATVVWEKKYAPQNDAKWLSDNHDFVLVYAKNKATWRPNLLPRSEATNAPYKNPDNDPRGSWRTDNILGQHIRPHLTYPIVQPKTGETFMPPSGYCWRMTPDKFAAFVADNRIWWGKDGKGKPQVKRFLSEVKQGMTSLTVWRYNDVGHTQDAKREIKALFPNDVFTTPKPERLVERILTLASNPGDLVLDCFLGSGTTAAVAHKMKRGYLGVEMGEQAYTHCKTRLDKVIAGTDPGGVTASQQWASGGGYWFCEVADHPVAKDEDGEYELNPKFGEADVARAVAAYENARYQPDGDVFWKQARRSETSWLWTTLQHVTAETLANIHAQMADEEDLDIACPTFKADLAKLYANITLKKIPDILLQWCRQNGYDVSRTDYSATPKGGERDA